MNSVEYVKAVCKERKIPISKLEKDLGFGNGYIGQLRKGIFPYDRAVLIGEYLNISAEFLATGKEAEKAPTDNDGREVPHAAYREVLQEGGIRLLLDTDAKVSEDTLHEIVEFIKFKQMRNDQ